MANSEPTGASKSHSRKKLAIKTSVTIAKAIWKLLNSKAVLLLAVAGAGYLWYNEWQAHKATAAIRAEHYVTVTTKEASTWETTRFVCAAGPVQIVTELSDEEILRLAEDHGLRLERRVPFLVPGGSKTVEVPVFRDRDGNEVRALGEKEIESAPWGGKLFAGLDQEGGLYGDFKPTAEPFTEPMHSLRLWLGAGYGLHGGGVNAGIQSGVILSAGLAYDWRRFGRFHVLPFAEADWSSVGSSARFGLRISREQLPVRWRQK